MKQASPLKILLIDDDEDEYVLVQGLLSEINRNANDGAERAQFQLYWVKTYDAAMQAFSQGQHDVYLVDYHLGEKDGLELIREAVASGCNAPMILMTGVGSYDLDLRGMRVGAVDYLSKGEVTAPLLERSIRYAVEHKRTEDALRKARDELDLRVQERTRELILANQGLQIEITERRRAEARAQALLRIAGRLNSNLDELSVLRAVCEETTRALNVPAAGVALADDEADELYHAAGMGLPDLAARGPKENISLYDGLVPGEKASAAMIQNEQSIGMLTAFALDRKCNFGEDERKLLQGLADQAALAIANALLYKKLENALKEEQAMRMQLIQAEKHSAISRMVASVAHELNNPIQTIQNCLFLIQQDFPPESDLAEYAEVAYSETRRVAGLVMQLREIYRPSKAGPMQPTDVIKLLNEVRSLLLPHLQHQRVAWSQVEWPEKVIITATTDQIKQVFLNISLNAIEAMQPEGGKIIVSVIIPPGSDLVEIGFKDNGPGIEAENISKLFDPFFTTKESGTGLGLAICYDIVQRHKGQIRVESQPGLGAAFFVCLPLG